MVYSKRAELPAPVAHPTICQQSKSEAVGAAGDSDGYEWLVFEERERSDRSAEFGMR